MRILVTGASGFIGNNVAKHLVNLGHEVLMTWRENEQPAVPGATAIGPSFISQDPEWLEGIEAVLHQAANNDPQSKDLLGIYKTNVLGTATLFEQLYNKGCRKFIYASSTAVYGANGGLLKEYHTTEPLTPYAYSKMAMEQYVNAFHRLRPDAHCLGLRYCNVYGPGESHKGHRASMIHQIIKVMREGKSPKLFKYGHQMRDWVYVQDVVQANLLALESTDFRDEVLNIGSGEQASFKTLVGWINSILGTNMEPEWIANPYEGTYQDNTLCDISVAKAILGYYPKFPINLGINHYIENWQ